MGKTAILLGASGLTGGHLLSLLLANPVYTSVITFNRKSLHIPHSKHTEYCIDFNELQHYKSKFIADVVFCCIGSTKAKTPDPDLYRSIDFDIPVTAAQLCKTNGIPTFIVMSAIGANSASSIFYNQLKGDMETAVLKIGVDNTYLLRPSLIAGKRPVYRPAEGFTNLIMRLINPLLIGALANYRSISYAVIAKAMISLAHELPLKTTVITSKRIALIAKNYEYRN